MIGFLGIRRHARLRDLLSAYMDGQVSESDARQVETHLSECEACRWELGTLRATIGLLRELPELAAPRSFTFAEAPVRAAMPPIVWTGRLATCVAALLLVALLLGDVLGLATQQIASRELTAAPSLAPMAPADAAPSVAAERILESAASSEPPTASSEPTLVPAGPAAAMAAAPAPPERDLALEGERAAVTLEAEEAPPSAEAKEEPVAALQQEDVSPPAAPVAPPAPDIPSDEAESEAGEGDGGLRLPLWQLEVAAGGLFLLLALATWWIARRARRKSQGRGQQAWTA